MQAVPKAGALIGLLLIGFVLGPLLVAAAGGLQSLKPPATKLSAASNLLDAFAYYQPEPQPMFSTNADGMIRDCGYERDSVFRKNDDLSDFSSWTPYNGYFDLSLWVSDDFYRQIRSRRVDRLTKELSVFSLQFLNDCLRQTVFASMCARRVSDILARAGLSSSYSLSGTQPRPDQSRQFFSVCTYLDGIVARHDGRLTEKKRAGRWPDY